MKQNIAFGALQHHRFKVKLETKNLHDAKDHLTYPQLDILIPFPSCRLLRRPDHRQRRRCLPPLVHRVD